MITKLTLSYRCKGVSVSYRCKGVCRCPTDVKVCGGSTYVKGFRGLLGEQVEDLLCVGAPVGGAQVFIAGAQLSPDVIQSYALVPVALEHTDNTQMS
jgi:hypothetical protein